MAARPLSALRPLDTALHSCSSSPDLGAACLGVTVSEGRAGLGAGASSPPHLAGGRVFRQVWGAPAGVSGCPPGSVTTPRCGRWHTGAECSGAKARGNENEGRGVGGRRPLLQGPGLRDLPQVPAVFPGSQPAGLLLSLSLVAPEAPVLPLALLSNGAPVPEGQANSRPIGPTRVSCLLCSRATPRASQARPHSPGSHLRENREAQRRAGAPARE